MKSMTKMFKYAKVANDISRRDLGVHLTKPGMALRFYVIDALGFTPPLRKYLYSKARRRQKWAPIGTMVDGRFQPTILMEDHGNEIVTWAEAIKGEYKGVHTSEISIRRGTCMDRDNALSEVRVASGNSLKFSLGNYTPIEYYFAETKFVYCAFFDRRCAKPKLRVWKVPGEAMRKALRAKFEKTMSNYTESHSGGGAKVVRWSRKGYSNIRDVNNDKPIALCFSEREIYRICDGALTPKQRMENRNQFSRWGFCPPYHEQDLDF